MYKEVLLISIMCILVLVVGCTMSPNNQESSIVQDEKTELLSIPDIEQCKDQYVHQFFQISLE